MARSMSILDEPTHLAHLPESERCLVRNLANVARLQELDMVSSCLLGDAMMDYGILYRTFTIKQTLESAHRIARALRAELASQS